MNTTNVITDAQKAHVSMVFTIAISDGHLDDAEKAWTAAVAKSLGMTFSEMMESIDEKGGNLKVDDLPAAKSDRAVILSDCLHCAMSDGKLTEQEREALLLTAFVLDFDGDEYSKILDLTFAAASDDAIRQAFA